MERGTVLKIENDKLTIRFAKNDACAKCGGCEIKDDHAILSGLKNTVGAQVGDSVYVDMSSTNIVAASFIIYLLPVIGLVFGYFIGAALAGILGFSKNVAIIAALAFFVASFPLISLIDKRIAGNANFSPTIVKKI